MLSHHYTLNIIRFMQNESNRIIGYLHFEKSGFNVPATILLFSITCLAKIWFNCRICSLCRFSSTTFLFKLSDCSILILSSERRINDSFNHIISMQKVSGCNEIVKWSIPLPSGAVTVVSDNIFLIASAFFNRCSCSSAVNSGVYKLQLF